MCRHAALQEPLALPEVGDDIGVDAIGGHIKFGDRPGQRRKSMVGRFATFLRKSRIVGIVSAIARGEYAVGRGVYGPSRREFQRRHFQDTIYLRRLEDLLNCWVVDDEGHCPNLS